jgi:hypothetical protein
MGTDLPLRCRCGNVRGHAVDVSPDRGSHVVCYCDDCQAFIRFLQRDDILDAHGGSDIFQMTPAQLRISTGAEHIRCMRLTPKGLRRWYADCCNTPIANTAGPRLPFAGMLTCLVDPAADSAARERAFGPIIGHAFGKYARGGLPANATAGTPLKWLLRMTRLMGRAFIAGKHRPSPFFGDAGAPVSEAKVLTAEERARLR